MLHGRLARLLRGSCRKSPFWNVRACVRKVRRNERWPRVAFRDLARVLYSSGGLTFAPASEQSWSPATRVSTRSMQRRWYLPSRSGRRRPEVEALLRLSDAGLRVEEVPVRMEPRAGGVSKLRGRKAVKVTATVFGTLVAARLLRARRSD